MIDYVSINQIIPLTSANFNLPLWNFAQSPNSGEFLWHKKRGVTVYYYPSSHRLIINGKLITLLHDTQVSNFDDIYGNLRDEFIADINQVLNSLFTAPVLDIQTFHTTRIDYCFNVETPYVDDYIHFLSRAFQTINTGRRTDYAYNFGLHGSIYIKNYSEYEKNIRTNYTLNVYNKANRLEYLCARRTPIPPSDFLLAKDLLRIEVQASYGLIKAIRKHFSIDQTFGALFNYDVAQFAISSVFKRVFHLDPSCDFYTYQAAKQLTHSNTAPARLLYILATNHNVSAPKYTYQRQQLAQLGIYPYHLLHKNTPAPFLKSPLKLISDKISTYRS